MNGLVKKALIFFAVMALVGAAGWFGRKAYKHSVEHRLLEQAGESIKNRDWRTTDLCLQRVLQINPSSAEASKMVADMLEIGGSPDELSWRIRVAKLQPSNVTNRFLWAKSAFRLHNFASATEALAGVDAKWKTTAEYHKIDGAVAWGNGDAAEAETQYLEALRLEPDNVTVLNLATIHLASTNQAVVKAGRQSLMQLTTNATLRITAIKLLLAEAGKRKSLPDAIVYSKEIAYDPSASFSDKIVYLQVLKAANSHDFTPWLDSLKKTAVSSPSNVFALGQSLAATENPAVALRWLQALPAQLQTNQPIPLIISDCQITLKDWNGLFSLVSQYGWGQAEFYQLALKSLAQRSLGKSTDSQNCWQKALRLSENRLDALSQLNHATAIWGWTSERIEVLRIVLDEFPEEKWAVDQLMAQLYLEGHTRELVELLSKIQAANPTDAHLKNNLANLLLLRGSEMDKANHLAKEAYKTLPEDPFIISTYAYSLLLQGKPDEATKILTGMKPEYLKIPSIAAYYGAIQAQTGHKNLARACLSFAETAKLLPEEKEMIRLANAQL
jgi:Flp pilus assembly protein TadD